MKKAYIITVIVVVLLMVGGIITLIYHSEEPTKNSSNSNIVNKTQNFNNAGVRISIDIPEGWQTSTANYQYNTVPGGGPIKAIELSPENADNTGLLSDTNVSIFSYNFNPEASLADVVPLIIGSGTIVERSELVMIDERDLRHLVITGESNPTLDTETPAFRRELYIGRFEDGLLFEMNIGYQNSNSYNQYKDSVDSILDTLRWSD